MVVGTQEEEIARGYFPAVTQVIPYVLRAGMPALEYGYATRYGAEI
jgi:hypothetical protein